MTLAQARREVASRTDLQIERETAFKWAYRAIACYERARTALEKGHDAERTQWLIRGDDYRHEALEHGALVGDYGRTVGKIEKQIDKVMKRTQRGGLKRHSKRNK